MAYVVKWRVRGSWIDEKPYLVDAGKTAPNFIAPKWTAKQKEARRFASVEEAKAHVISAYADPKDVAWLRDRELRFVRLVPRKATS